MSALLEKIRTQLRPDDKRSVDVPEWGDESGPLVVWFRLPTLAELSMARAVAKDDPIRLNVELVVMKAMDVEGKMLFQRADAVELMHLAGAAGGVSRIATAMGLVGESPADAEKN